MSFVPAGVSQQPHRTPLGRWVLEEACRQLMHWNAPGREPLHIAVNVSPLQLMRTNFVAEVRDILSTSGIDPAWLEMEITERVVLNFDVIATRMQEISAMGIRFAVDDSTPATPRCSICTACPSRR